MQRVAVKLYILSLADLCSPTIEVSGLPIGALALFFAREDKRGMNLLRACGLGNNRGKGGVAVDIDHTGKVLRPTIVLTVAGVRDSNDRGIGLESPRTHLAKLVDLRLAAVDPFAR
jgi:hypothetical protein